MGWMKKMMMIWKEIKRDKDDEERERDEDRDDEGRVMMKRETERDLCSTTRHVMNDLLMRRGRISRG